jgi:hypothetical protein
MAARPAANPPYGNDVVPFTIWTLTARIRMRL